jgi:hypothetical protein
MPIVITLTIYHANHLTDRAPTLSKEVIGKPLQLFDGDREACLGTLRDITADAAEVALAATTQAIFHDADAICLSVARQEPVRSAAHKPGNPA